MVQDNPPRTETGDGQRGPHRLAFILLGLFATVAAACALYVPFLGNKLVFDDFNLYRSLAIFDFAQIPFNLVPRTFPYFTLGFVEVTWHSIEIHRVISLALHLLNAFMIFRLSRVLLQRIDGISETRAIGLALLAANIFALHPVAVYGAAYLVQRTILLATLFSLLSIWFYLRGLARNRIADCVTAALFYGLAVFSKQHAIMLPAAAVLLSPLFCNDWRQHWRKTALYLALCAPSAIWVVLATKGIVGTQYEVDADEIAAQMSADMLLGSPLERWFASAVSQMGLFFDYLRAWFLPDVRTMSIDMRVDFAATWTGPLIALRILAFLACPLIALRLLAKHGRPALFGAGLLYAWLLYMTELASVRFQEPFVLYRSYLWAPGYLLMALAPLSLLGRKKLLVVAIVGLPFLLFSAENRLRTFIDEFHVWQDAAAKLPSDRIPGAGRIYYNRGRELAKAKRYREAIADMDRVIAQYPRLFQAYREKGLAAAGLQDYPLAMACFDRTLQLKPDDASTHFASGLILEQWGRRDEALAAYSRSLALGSTVAKLKIEALKTKLRQPNTH